MRLDIFHSSCMVAVVSCLTLVGSIQDWADCRNQKTAMAMALLSGSNTGEISPSNLSACQTGCYPEPRFWYLPSPYCPVLHALLMAVQLLGAFVPCIVLPAEHPPIIHRYAVFTLAYPVPEDWPCVCGDILYLLLGDKFICTRVITKIVKGTDR